MDLFDNEIMKFLKKGFKTCKYSEYGVRIPKKKYGKVSILEKRRKGMGADIRFLYYVNGDANQKSMREFLKGYSNFKAKIDQYLRTASKAIFMCSGKLDKELFRDLKKGLDKGVAKTISVKTLPRVTFTDEEKASVEKKGKRRIRRLTAEERASIIRKVGNRCCFPRCKVTDPQLLEVHHITRIADEGTNKENNLIVLCANHHRKITDSKLGKAFLRQYSVAKKKRY